METSIGAKDSASDGTNGGTNGGKNGGTNGDTDGRTNGPTNGRTSALDAPLPAALVGRDHGWFGRYRRYPVFSAPWVRGRARSVGVAVTLFVALSLVGTGVNTPSAGLLGGLIQLAANLLVPVFAGPWLASLVRRRQGDAQHEWWGLVGVIVAMVLALGAFNQWAAEPLKQSVAQSLGQVDADGKRKRVSVSLGVSINNPDEAASATATTNTRPGAPGQPNLVNHLGSGLITFWLAGGAGLWAWRRERRGLAALAAEQALQHAQAQRHEAEMRLSVLAAQVEPHFLFNTLAGVRSAISTDPARASDMIDRLVEYLRASIPRLRSDGAVQATLGAQAEIVQAYLGLMSSRMPRLKTSVHIPADLRDAPCPPLMLISLAENAVKHGAEPKIGPVQIELSALRNAHGELEVTVADDGAGFGHSSGGSGLGLVNIRERLAQMYAGRARLALTARPQGGIAATLTLPME